MFIKITAALILLTSSFEFYWYGYRPKQIRAECETQAVVRASATFRNKTNYDVQADYAEGSYAAEDKEQYYTSCLRGHGLVI
jgi:hypothetical protein